jgi:predicted nucleotidyltransferase component of viral defense system
VKKYFLHELDSFKDLIEITAKSHNIGDPFLVEKDYWIMHVLWSLQHLGFLFHLKGGTSLSKGYGCIHRFSEDIDIKIEPDESQCKFKVYGGKNHDDDKQRKSRNNYYEWLNTHLDRKIAGITQVKRDTVFDDIPKFRSGGIRLIHETKFANSEGIKDGILLEVGFDQTTPNLPRTISSWAYEFAKQNSTLSFEDNRALNVLCYEPKYTFVEKLQAVTKKYQQFKDGNTDALPENFIRHYYDLYQLLERDDVQTFIGTPEYKKHKSERFRGQDQSASISKALKLSDAKDRAIFESAYNRSKTLYYQGRPTLTQILERISKDIERL